MSFLLIIFIFIAINKEKAAKMYVIPSDIIIPTGPNHKANIETNFESPLPKASFLKKYFADDLIISNVK